MAIEALSLALDGVIFETEDLHLQACNAAFESCGLGLRWSVQQLREAARVHGATNAVNALLEKLPLTARDKDAIRLMQEKNRIFHELAQGGAVRNSACEQLMAEALDAGCKLAVVTDMPVHTATAMLEQSFGNDVTNMFAVVVSGASFNASAGNGPFQLTLRTVGVEPVDCAAIDSSAPGLRAAQQAGIWTMAVTPYEKDIARISGANMWCPQLQELRHLIEQRKSPRKSPAKFIDFDVLRAFKDDRPDAMPVRLAA